MHLRSFTPEPATRGTVPRPPPRLTPNTRRTPTYDCLLAPKGACLVFISLAPALAASDYRSVHSPSRGMAMVSLLQRRPEWLLVRKDCHLHPSRFWLRAATIRSYRGLRASHGYREDGWEFRPWKKVASLRPLFASIDGETLALACPGRGFFFYVRKFRQLSASSKTYHSPLIPPYLCGRAHASSACRPRPPREQSERISR